MPQPYKPYGSYKSAGNFSNAEIKPNDTFNTLFGGRKTYDDLKLLATDPVYIKLTGKYKEVFDAGLESGLRYGEIQVMINRFSGGKDIHDIEYRRLDELKYFVRCKADTVLETTSPELHDLLIRSDYHKKSATEIASKNRSARIARIIRKLSGKSNSREKLGKFAEILSRL
jgi:hypothetical protein